MKTTMKVLLIAAVVLVGAGVIGLVVFNGIGAAADNTAYNDSYRQSYLSAYNDSYGRGMMGGWLDNDEDDVNYYDRGMMGEWIDADDDEYCDYYEEAEGYYGNGMMGRYYIDNTGSGEKLELTALEQNVNEYAAQFGDNLVIGDILVFEDGAYYFSVMESDTGIGAMELLVNPYTGAVYQQMGPNMMWNTKYEVQTSTGYGIMNGRGMMGRNAYNASEDGQELSTITLAQAQEIAENYLNGGSLEGYKLTGEGHEFYGYYTFNLQDENSQTGLISVNGFTGAVWYHGWNGSLTDTICRYNG